MTNLQKRLEEIIVKTQQRLISDNQILPQKTSEGILVGNVLIVSEGTQKHIFLKGEFVYRDINLKAVAIRIANLLANNHSTIYIDKIYQADREYGKWFTDSQILRTQHQKAINNKDYDRADILWARYCESREKAISAKYSALVFCINNR